MGTLGSKGLLRDTNKTEESLYGLYVHVFPPTIW